MKRQATVRSFNAVCKNCGNPIFFWEGSAGSKVIFDAPVYGKLIKHVCRGKKRKKKSFVKKTHSEHSTIDIYRTSYQCPVCGKLFDHNDSLQQHIKQMEKTEVNHMDFFSNALDMLKMDSAFEVDAFKKIEKEDYIDNKYGVIFKKKNEKTY